MVEPQTRRALLGVLLVLLLRRRHDEHERAERLRMEEEERQERRRKVAKEEARRRKVRLVCFLVSVLVAGVAALSATHGLRGLLGAAHVYHKGKYEAVCLMMKPAAEGGKPQQFYSTFRMLPGTYDWLLAQMWEQKLRARRVHAGGARHALPGPPPDWHVFSERLLITIYFLATGCCYNALSFTWGRSLDYGCLLIAELDQLSSEFVKWPIGYAMYMACKENEKLRGFKGLCGFVDCTFIKIHAPWTQV
jgi:hypothetical protein